MAPSPLRRVATNAAVMTVTLGICLGFTEAAVRLLHKPVPTVLTNIDLKNSRYYQRDPEIGWRPRPTACRSAGRTWLPR